MRSNSYWQLMLIWTLAVLFLIAVRDTSWLSLNSDDGRSLGERIDEESIHQRDENGEEWIYPKFINNKDEDNFPKFEYLNPFDCKYDEETIHYLNQNNPNSDKNKSQDEIFSKLRDLIGSRAHFRNFIFNNGIVSKLSSKNSNDQEKLSKTTEISNVEGIKSFRDMRNYKGFIDKTEFILHFNKTYGDATVFLRPKRSGKSIIISMLKDFYCVPKIDIKSYDPVTKIHKNSNETARDLFNGTNIMSLDFRKKSLGKGNEKIAKVFLKDYMNQFPVITLDFRLVKFTSYAPTKSEIYQRIYKKAILKWIQEYEEFLFIQMMEAACDEKYGNSTKANMARLEDELGLIEKDMMSKKMKKLWNNFQDKFSEKIKTLYRLYAEENISKEDIIDSVIILAETLHKFYKKEVIVLVDEHDYPSQDFYREITFDNPTKNKEIMQAIKDYSDVITDILEQVGKGCIYTKKFIMFGISNSIVNQPNSGFNSMTVCNVFNAKDAHIFAMSQGEMNELVDKMFKIPEKPRNVIKERVERWYNGYYQDKTNTPLYSIFSASLYISDCYVKYQENKIAPDDTSADWIPKPSKKWVQAGTSNIFDNYMNLGFKGKINLAILNLWRRLPALFSSPNEEYIPLFEDPTDPNIRPEIIFHLLMYGGYLTQDRSNSAYFRIPNLEIYEFLIKQMSRYVKSIAFHDLVITDLGESFRYRDYERMGRNIMRSLYDLSKVVTEGMYKADQITQRERYIHDLLQLILQPLETEKEGNFICMHEFGFAADNKIVGKAIKSDGQGGRMDHYVWLKDGAKYTHFLCEDKVKEKYEIDLTSGSQRALSQIFSKDYLRHLRKNEDTERIVWIGIAANTTNLAHAIIELDVVNGAFTQVSKLYLQNFTIVDDQNGVNIETSKLEENYLEINLTSPNDSNETEVYNKKLMNEIGKKLNETIDSYFLDKEKK